MLADAGHFQQPRGLFIDDLQRLGAKFTYDHAGKVRANTFDQPRSQVAFDSQHIHRHDAAERYCLELFAKTGMVD